VLTAQNLSEHRQTFFGAVLFVARKEDKMFSFAQASTARVLNPSYFCGGRL
jgi:hypothetical protein